MCRCAGDLRARKTGYLVWLMRWKTFFSYKMKILITAKPGARHPRVERIDDTHIVVAVKERPHDGKANAAIIKAVAAHFGVAASHVRIVSGGGARNKIVEIL